MNCFRVVLAEGYSNLVFKPHCIQTLPDASFSVAANKFVTWWPQQHDVIPRLVWQSRS